MCTPPPPHPLPMIAAPGQPARAGARVRTHGPRCRPRSPFLAAGEATAPRAGLARPGDPPPPERGGPKRPRSLLSAAGGRVATFVNCKQTHVVLQQSRPCLVLVAFPPALPPPPSRGGFLPLPPFSLSLDKGAWGARAARGAAARAATMQPRRGSGRGVGGRIGEPGDVFAGSGAAAGMGGRARVGVREWVGPERPALPAVWRRGLRHVGGRSHACRPRPGAVY